MKKLIFLLLFAFTAAFGQSDDSDSGEGGTSGSLRTNLGTLVQKTFTVEAVFELTKNWMIGPTISFFNDSKSTTMFQQNHQISGYGVGMRGDWYPKGVYKTGFYATTSLNMVTALASNKTFSGNSVNSNTLGWILSGGGGYHWFWNSLNVGLGAQITYPIKPATATMNLTTLNSEEIQISGSGFGVAPELLIGFCF